MRVCDHCRDLDKPVSGVQLLMIKPNPDNGRVKPEQVCEPLEAELCADCSPAIWAKMSESFKSIVRGK